MGEVPRHYPLRPRPREEGGGGVVENGREVDFRAVLLSSWEDLGVKDFDESG